MTRLHGLVSNWWNKLPMYNKNNRMRQFLPVLYQGGNISLPHLSLTPFLCVYTFPDTPNINKRMKGIYPGLPYGVFCMLEFLLD